MPSVNSSLQELGSSVVSIFFGLLHSLLAVFYAILALGQDFINAFLNLSHAVLKAAVEISGGVVELLWSTFLVLHVVRYSLTRPTSEFLRDSTFCWLLLSIYTKRSQERLEEGLKLLDTRAPISSL